LETVLSNFFFSSIECSVKFELAKGVTEIILMDLKMIEVDTGFPQEPSSSFNVSFQPSQWHDGMRLTTNNVLRLRFLANREHRNVYFQVRANAEVCKSDVVEIPG
jgi:hypothetical protein